MRIDLPLCSFKDCRHNFDGNCRSEERKEKCEFDVYKKAFEEQPKIGGWIPCSERLPEEEGVYLVTKPNFGNWVVDTMYFCRGSFTDKYVIAWQPLPEVYHG